MKALILLHKRLHLTVTSHRLSLQMRRQEKFCNFHPWGYQYSTPQGLHYLASWIAISGELGTKDTLQLFREDVNIREESR